MARSKPSRSPSLSPPRPRSASPPWTPWVTPRRRDKRRTSSTRTHLDVAPPRLVATTPADGAGGVDPATLLQVEQTIAECLTKAGFQD